MRTLDDVLDQFAYHPATPATAPLHALIRDHFADFVKVIYGALPEGAERTIVMRKLQEAQMYANLAIALTAPADLSPARSVARVLPTDRPHFTSVTPGDSEVPPGDRQYD